MTEKTAYENILRELKKSKAPSLHLEDYNYWMNKGVQEYINSRYNEFAKSQQLSDDLQALTTSTEIIFTVSIFPVITYVGTYTGGYTQINVPVSTGKQYGSDYIRFSSPDNYLHFLGSHVNTKTTKITRCYPAGYEESLPSKRLVDDIGNGVINNAYLKPSHQRPYHSFKDNVSNASHPDLLYFAGNLKESIITSIHIDYLKVPQVINLTETEVNLPIDNSAVLEFPEYVCNEIVKFTVKLILEGSSDPRLQTYIPVNKTIP